MKTTVDISKQDIDVAVQKHIKELEKEIEVLKRKNKKQEKELYKYRQFVKSTKAVKEKIDDLSESLVWLMEDATFIDLGTYQRC